MLIFISLASVSCVSKKPVEPVIITNTKEITHTVHDTIFKIAADSAYYEALIECQNGKPVIRDTPETKANSKAGRSLNQPKAVIDDGKLKVTATKNEEELHKQWEETYIKEHEQKPIYVPRNVYTDRPLTFWQNLQIWLGRIFLGIITLGVLLFVLQARKII